MKNLVINDYSYFNILIKDDNTLLKYSMVRKAAWERLQSKNIDFINTPTEISYLNKKEKEKYPNRKSKIQLPFLRTYKALADSEHIKYADTETILNLYKKNVQLLEILHKNNIFHGDINCDNIMINKDFNINFIDFEEAIIDNYVSDTNSFADDNISLLEKKKKTMIVDKLELFSIYLTYLANGEFDIDTYNINLAPLALEYNLVKEIRSYLNKDTEPTENYYFIDIVDNLLKKGYESPVLKKKKSKDSQNYSLIKVN